MIRYMVISMVVVFSILGFEMVEGFEGLVWEDLSQANLHIATVLVDKDTPGVIFSGTKNSVLKTTDGGLSWRVVFSLKGKNSRINLLLSDSSVKGKLYAATANGLFHSTDYGNNWKRIFKGKNILENECTALVILPEHIYLGTAQGLFSSQDGGRSWRNELGKIGNSRILNIAINPREPARNYCLSVTGLFKFNDRLKNWEKIFAAQTKEGEKKDGDESEYLETISDMRHVAIGPRDSNRIYLATSKGVYESSDAGVSWKFLTNHGLLNNDVNFILLAQDQRLYALTKSGLFEFNNERWVELTLHLLAHEFNYLALDNAGNMYLACDKGLFKGVPDSLNNVKFDTALNSYSNGEPSIREIQKAAIQYAEVDMEKIKDWRRRAANKAWFPQVNCGINRAVTDLWHWEGGSTTKSDDDSLRKGRDSIEWDVSLNWDLGELIWNQDQTSIDSRSKLMVELRDDILDGVTKLYFERIRVKIELDNVSLEERKKNQELELRLKELSASLDAMTGGYFSQNIKVQS